MKCAQVVAVEHRQALARIEDEGDAGSGQLRARAQHRVAAVGRDDGEADVGARGHRRLVRLLHRAGMERGDLVVVAVRDDDGLRRVVVGGDADVSVRRAPSQPREVVVRRRCRARRAPRARRPAGQRVGDVAGAAAELAPQRRHEERHVQDVQLLGQDLVREAARKVVMVSKAREPQTRADMRSR